MIPSRHRVPFVGGKKQGDGMAFVFTRYRLAESLKAYAAASILFSAQDDPPSTFMMDNHEQPRNMSKQQPIRDQGLKVSTKRMCEDAIGMITWNFQFIG